MTVARQKDIKRDMIASHDVSDRPLSIAEAAKQIGQTYEAILEASPPAISNGAVL